MVNTRTNSFKNIPLLLKKNLGVPKNALSSWYGKRHKACFVSNCHFRTLVIGQQHMFSNGQDKYCIILDYGDKYMKNKDTSKDAASKYSVKMSIVKMSPARTLLVAQKK